MPRSDAIQRWWPTTQALDLVEGTPATVAAALSARVRGFVADERLDTTWVDVACFDDALRQAADFGNVPTTFVVLPTRSRWSVLWNNGFLCNGYDTLCLGLTRHHGLTTVHWCAHDATTTFQPGASFCHRRRQGTDVVERRVTVASDDGRWHFFASGEPLPEEQPAAYAARRTRGRLDERLVAELLARLGASPWDEGFYAFDRSPVFVLHRPDAPPTVTRKSRAVVLAGTRNDAGPG
jgi:hypothetical protein